jgi:hypothetical protein
MKKSKLYNQLRHQLKEEKLHIYEPGGEFHELGNQHMVLWQPLLVPLLLNTFLFVFIYEDDDRPRLEMSVFCRSNNKCK